MSRRTYNALLRERWRRHGLCVECGGENATYYRRCPFCREKNRARVERFTWPSGAPRRAICAPPAAPSAPPPKTPITAYWPMPAPGSIALSFFKHR